jgi:hypothetical protein
MISKLSVSSKCGDSASLRNNTSDWSSLASSRPNRPQLNSLAQLKPATQPVRQNGDKSPKGSDGHNDEKQNAAPARASSLDSIATIT